MGVNQENTRIYNAKFNKQNIFNNKRMKYHSK